MNVLADSHSLRCPHCQSPLIIDKKTWQCDGSMNAKQTKHPFDVARQGYVNLLPVQQKKSKAPGDSADSIAARQRFLAQGYYQPLRDAVMLQIKKHIAQQPKSSHQQATQQYKKSQVNIWLDVGCGDGYYTQAMAQIDTLDALLAVDISKPAVSCLAKTLKQTGRLGYLSQQRPVIYPLVASAAQLPIADTSLIGISSIFSPILPTEFARVLKVGGILVIAKPDEAHLASMRAGLFEQVRTHDSDKFLTQLAPFFALLSSEQVQCSLSLNADALADLLTMTPYAYRAAPAKREALLAQSQVQPLQTQARFIIYTLRCHSNSIG
ncbi:putative RNA methyltransferase [Psychrobacter sp. I-STPA10]|uniref:putative RNA methyltransferase n=1 Tax=Psychrobacter sp. I-STPA10 TaxID=2585769 RepID=UPI001E494E22|nr:methyltransferase domain-containing protein [Psychrobacter sp. I-STPA10]